jgi:N-acetyltransferase
MGSQKITPRTHRLFVVDIAGECYLCDVGFGGEGLLLPIPLRIDQPATQFSWTYRIVTDGPFHVLQSRRGDEWLDLYAFTLEEAHPVDYEVANYYISTNPHSPFMHMIFVARPGADVRYALMNRRLIERRPLMLSSDRSQIGTGSSNSPRSAKESAMLSILRRTACPPSVTPTRGIASCAAIASSPAGVQPFLWARIRWDLPAREGTCPSFGEETNRIQASKQIDQQADHTGPPGLMASADSGNGCRRGNISMLSVSGKVSVCDHSAAQQREGVLVAGQPIPARINEVAPHVFLDSTTCDGSAPVRIIAEKKSRERAGGFQVIYHDFAVQRVRHDFEIVMACFEFLHSRSQVDIPAKELTRQPNNVGVRISQEHHRRAISAKPRGQPFQCISPVALRDVVEHVRAKHEIGGRGDPRLADWRLHYFSLRAVPREFRPQCAVGLNGDCSGKQFRQRGSHETFTRPCVNEEAMRSESIDEVGQPSDSFGFLIGMREKSSECVSVFRLIMSIGL